MLLLDILLLVMIAICVGYCWTVNRRIQDLQDSRIEFARMVKELNLSIAKAVNSVNELEGLGKSVNLELNNNVVQANNVLDELANHIGIAQDLLNNVKNIDSKKTLNNNVSGEFTDEDFIDDEEALNLDNTINENISSKDVDKLFNLVKNKRVNNSVNLSQSNYYDLLRRVNKK